MKYMVTIKTPKDIQHLRKAGKILALTLNQVVQAVKPGIQTIELDKLAEQLFSENRVIASFKNFTGGYTNKPFPTTICASVNNEVVHAPASPRLLQDGDIVGIDLGLKYLADGKYYFVDAAKTVAVGHISKLAAKLITVTKKALDLGIKQVKRGNFISDIGKTIQPYVEKNHFFVVRELVGHGVGFAVHEDPRIPNYYDSSLPPIKLQEGMVLAIEPMVNIGTSEIKTLEDEWTVVTADGSLSAHFEHTVVVMERGCEILTCI